MTGRAYLRLFFCCILFPLSAVSCGPGNQPEDGADPASIDQPGDGGDLLDDDGPGDAIDEDNKPIAIAGRDRDVHAGDMVILDGSASFDPDGTDLTYAWFQNAGPKVAIHGVEQATASFTAPEIAGDSETLAFELVVSSNGSSASDDVEVVIVPTHVADLCPEDPLKDKPGICGCGVPDDDSDGDGTADCIDGCPEDPDKIESGDCGCGNPETDSDGDGVADCKDGCPDDPNKVDPGECGCGVEETPDCGEQDPGEIPNDHPGLVALWHLNESAGSMSFADSSGNGHDGACTGDACPSAEVEGQIGTAVAFDGSNDVIITSRLDFSSAFSWSLWFKPQTMAGQWRALMTQDDRREEGWHWLGLWFNPEGELRWGSNGCGEHGAVTASPQLNHWHHLAVTFDGAAVEVFFDGVSAGTFASDGCHPETELALGNGSSDLGDPFHGGLDEIAIWNRVLTPEEISWLSGSGPACGNGICEEGEDPFNCADCAECGNGVIEEGETCETNDSEPCTTNDGYDGTRSCLEDCSGLGACESDQFCGDGTVNGPEECEVNGDCGADMICHSCECIPDGGSEGACNDGIDNDGDGLVDWQFDLGCHGPDDDNEMALPRDLENGWTTYDPSSDTRIVYVSSSDGDDATAEVDNPNLPFETIDVAKQQLRNGYPDWMLLKRGNVWYESLGGWGENQQGPSDSERMVVASYGSSTERPLLKVGSSGGISICCGPHSNLTFLGIHMYAHTRDPNSEEFSGTDGGSGVRRCCGAGGNLLVEDCYFHFFKSVVLQTGSDGAPENIEFRRNVVAENYSTESHSQGVYASHVDGLLIEENVFYHNGYNEDVAGAEATMFNHNTYLNGNDVVLRGNTFMRPSSMGTKFRSDPTDGFVGLLVEDNLYFDGEIGISLGGNTDEPLRFRDATVRNNVFTHIGLSNPTGRNFAWYMGVTDVNGADISGNYFLHQPWYGNTHAISMGGGTNRNITIQDNVTYDIYRRSFSISATSAWENILITGNTLQDVTHGSQLIEHSGTFGPVTYSNNTHFTSADADAWFKVDGGAVSYADWLTVSGETGSSARQVPFVDPDRDLATYQAFLGKEATFDAFIAETRKQSKYYWREEYTATAVNDYVRGGFQEQEP